MNQKLKTSIEFTKNLFVTGAFMETSRKVELEICRHLPKVDQAVVVEFGMGHGNITQQILNQLSSKSKLYAFEINPDFCEHVKNKINDNRLIIINDGAENLKLRVTEPIHSVIASIPFTFFSKEKAMGIIQDAYDSLVDQGYFSQVLYTRFNFRKFKKIFDECEILKVPNIPTEYVYHCKKNTLR
ncbi:MAG: methyltransferase domain-containing protein [Bacteroidia bacterium]